jgi:hypothetical protein
VENQRVISQIKKYPFLWLSILAVIAGSIWRIELEQHGWQGIEWLQYFHLAIPAGYILFLLWANAILEVNIRKRILLNLVALAYGVFMYFILLYSLSYFFVTGPSNMLLRLESPWIYYLLTFSVFLVVPLLPLGARLILRAFRLRVKSRYCLYSIVGMIVSVPLACILLWMVNHKGGDDLIHTIKSGFLIPLWFISMGIPVKFIRSS